MADDASLAATERVYADLEFPEPGVLRPYTFINMVSTIDGKTVSASGREPVADLGSELDHSTMRAIESKADAILIGAGNLRSTPGLWYPREKIRCVATRSGELDYSSRFFSDAPDKAFVICPAEVAVPDRFHKLSNDFSGALKLLRTNFGVKRLLIEGGSELNAELLKQDLVDELFLTLAPKIKLGRDLPTYAGGDSLPGHRMQKYELLEHHAIGSEIFARYRRKVGI